MDQLKSNAKDVLYVFAQYGFQKASMQDLADAAGVSRQSLYNHYKSKDDVFAVVVRGYVEKLYSDAMTIFEKGGVCANEVLVDAFTRWVGGSISLIRATPHGAELMDRAIRSHQHNSMDVEDAFAAKVGQYIVKSGLVDPHQGALDDLVFTLIMVSKGLLLKSETEDDFRRGMARGVGALLSSSTTD